MTNGIPASLRSPAVLFIFFCCALTSCGRRDAKESIRVPDSSLEEPPGLKQQIAETAYSRDRPDLQFDTESHDFGTVFQMRSYECVFKFRNAGTADLKVMGVTSSCGCTATVVSAEELRPREEAELKVELSTGMTEGRIVKHMVVRSNDPDESVKRVRIEADVVARLSVKPKSFYFRQVRKREGATAWFDIAPTELEKIESVEVKCTSEHFHSELQSTGDENSQYRVKLSIADNAPLGRITGALEFFVDGETEICSRVPITAYLVGDIDVSPKRLLFRAKRGTGTELESIDVTSGTGLAFRIHAVSSDIPGLETELVSHEEGKRYSVIARLDLDAAAGRVRGNINIHTDNPLQPQIAVPVFGTVE